MKINITNTNSLFTDEYVEKAILFVCQHLKLDAIHVHLHDVWFPHDEFTGEPIGEVIPWVKWDGFAHYNTGAGAENFVIVHISPDIVYPHVWDINQARTDHYMRGMTFYDRNEFLIYFLAHEIRHIWQFQNPESEWLAHSIGGDHETDADLYAIYILNCFRQSSANHQII